MSEETKWKPQSAPEPPKTESSTTNQGPIPPAVPNTNANNKLPWFLWVLAGCGCLGLVIVPVGVVALFVIFNPAAKLNDANNNFYTREVENTGKAIKDCIEAETAKATPREKIYSAEICANKDYLYDNHYISVQPLSGLRISVDNTKSKICTFITYYDYSTKEYLVTSWDSLSRKFEIGNGTKNCVVLPTSSPQQATKSATASAK